AGPWASGPHRLSRAAASPSRFWVQGQGRPKRGCGTPAGSPPLAARIPSAGRVVLALPSPPQPVGMPCPAIRTTGDRGMETAVVTGTSTGIGFATSVHLARHGYRVFAGMRNLAKAEPLRAAASEENLPIEVIDLDVTSATSVDRAFEAISGHGAVDVLVNNAGIGGATPLELTPEDEHRRMFETNYFGAIRCIKAVLPAMRERRRGAIVNVTSIAGLVAIPNQIPYSASKWALECAGETLAHEV